VGGLGKSYRISTEISTNLLLIWREEFKIQDTFFSAKKIIIRLPINASIAVILMDNIR